MPALPRRTPLLVIGLCAAACGDDVVDPPLLIDDTFECADGRDGWEQCVDGAVQWCHVVPNIPPHFHSGAPCARFGYDCVEHGDNRASCVDTASSCTEGEVRCSEDNEALTCLDGRFAIRPCGTALVCRAEDGTAECVADSSPVDFAAIACATFEDETFAETKEVALAIEDVFDHAFHAEIGHPTTVDLPENTASYIHFPVEGHGDYVVSLSETGVLDAIVDREETVVSKAGGGPNERCSDVIRDHYEAHLHYEPPQGHSGPIPYVLRFASGPARAVTFLILTQ